MNETVKPSLLIMFVVLLLNSCSSDDSGGGDKQAVNGGKSGSMARFTIIQSYLYTVDNQNLQLFSLSNPEKPTLSTTISVGFGIETIFPYGRHLFLGSQQGMYIYNISNPATPVFEANYFHILSYDPVVVHGNYAYVTLREMPDSWRPQVNELQIIDISNISNPIELVSYNMVSPRGLAISNNLLFVCDDGLKMFDASNIYNLQLLQHEELDAYDVIALDDIIIVIGADGLYQYYYTINNLSFISKIPVATSNTTI